MDRLDAMAILLRVADLGGFSAAARDLGLPLATVSRRIMELETRLGARLLVRTTRSVSLTDAGHAYAAAARRILESVEEAERVAVGEYDRPRGRLVLTAPVLFGRLHVLPVVSEFLAAYPEISVQLSLSDRNLHLLDDHLDMAVRIGSLPDSSMVATRVGVMRTVVCAAPTLLADREEPRGPADLAALPCVSFDSLDGASVWSFRRPDGEGAVDVAIAPRLTVTTAEAAVWAATQGVGVTRVLHYQCADAVREGKLRILLPDHEPAPQPIHLVHAARGALPLKMRAFLDFAAARLRARLAIANAA